MKSYICIVNVSISVRSLYTISGRVLNKILALCCLYSIRDFFNELSPKYIRKLIFVCLEFEGSGNIIAALAVAVKPIRFIRRQPRRSVPASVKDSTFRRMQIYDCCIFRKTSIHKQLPWQAGYCYCYCYCYSSHLWKYTSLFRPAYSTCENECEKNNIRKE